MIGSVRVQNAHATCFKIMKMQHLKKPFDKKYNLSTMCHTTKNYIFEETSIKIWNIFSNT